MASRRGGFSDEAIGAALNDSDDDMDLGEVWSLFWEAWDCGGISLLHQNYIGGDNTTSREVWMGKSKIEKIKNPQN